MRLLAILAVLFAGVCFLTATRERTLLNVSAGGALLLLAGVLFRRSPSRLRQRPQIQLSGEGVSAVDGRGTRMHVAWSGLAEVGILTTSDGPWGEDVHVVLKDEGGAFCIVPHALASDLLKRLLRLPGFDHEKLIAAMGRTSEAKFVCWTGRPGDGRVAAETPPDPALPSG
ncbi:MAG TPA: hypothetical protein VFI53_12285 [Myxococcaceae bacterium]|nr:hypothetical protein [Myxococcaceae bacterium]